MQTPAHVKQRGLFISFEGPEGAGKTTQIELLARRLRAAGHAVHTTREPGGTPLGEQLRAVLLDPSASDRDPVIEALLMMAGRRDHLQQVIRPRLATGAIVITDRYVDSTYAYQGYGSGVDRQWIAATMGLVTDRLLPALTVLLDLDPVVGLERKYRLFEGDETASRLRAPRSGLSPARARRLPRAGPCQPGALAGARRDAARDAGWRAYLGAPGAARASDGYAGTRRERGR